MKHISPAALAASSRGKSQASYGATALRAKRQQARSRLEKARKVVADVINVCALDDHQARCIRAALSELEKAAIQAGAIGSDNADSSDEHRGGIHP